MLEGALSELTVVEYSLGPAGAMCAKTFADLGARVIKVEPPDGDPARRRGPFREDRSNPEASGIFLYLNANKLGVTLDIRNADDRRRFHGIVVAADIFVTDLQPAQASDLGVDSDTISRLSDDLIRVYVTPFGNTGPYRNWAGIDLIAWHMGGMGWETPAAFVTDPEKHTPLRGQGNKAMYFAGWVTAAGAMCALFHRERYGGGGEVDVSAMDAVASHIRGNFAMYSYDITRLPESREKAFFPWIWEAADGYVSHTFLLDHWWQDLKTLMGSPEWARMDKFDTLTGRRDHRDQLEPGVAEWTSKLTRAELYQALQSRGIPCFPVQTVDEVVASEHYNARDFFVEQQHPVAGSVKHPGAAVRMFNTPLSVRTPAPTLGQHNEEVRQSPSHAQEQGRNETPKASSRPTGNVDPQSNTPANRPLDGIRIIDFGWILSVPYAGGWLGSLGAEVIRVESNTRLEPGRSSLAGAADGTAGVNRSAIWNCLNHSKLGVTLNIRDPEAQHLVRDLVAVSDVVVENFATGVLDRLGLGYEDLRKIRPDLVMLSGSTMGTVGPDRDATGFGPNVCSYAGQPSITGYEGGQPQNLGGNWPDYLVGTIMVHSVLAALWHRRKTGQGQRIEIAMAEVVSSMMPEAFLDNTMNGRVPERIGNRDPHMAPHNVYRCTGDDQWVAIAVRSDDEWAELCRTIDRPELADDHRFSSLAKRKQNEDELDRLVSAWTSLRSPEEVAVVLQSRGVVAGPVMDVVALMGDSHFRERGNVVTMDHPEVGPREVAGLPLRFSRIPQPAYYPAPQLGQHNGDVFCDLIGLSVEELDSLKDSHAVH